jgi:putative ABC transport system permease protein
MTATTIPKVIPEIGVSAIRTLGTVIAALPLGVGAVVLASLLTVRRLLHLDPPATLRDVE